MVWKGIRFVAIAIASPWLVAFAQAADCSALRLTNSIIMNPIQDAEPLRIPATVGGISKSLVFDLNGHLNFISRDTVRDLSLNELSSRFRLGSLSAPAATYVTVPQVVFGNAQANNMQFIVADKPDPKINLPYVDLVSRDIFGGNDVDLDFGARRLNFFSPDHCEGKVVYWPHQALAIVPMTLEGGTIVVPVTLDGHSLRAIISTSVGQSTMNIEKAERQLGYAPDPPNPKIPRSRTTSYPMRFSTLTFDGITVANPLLQMRLFRPGIEDPEGKFPTFDYQALRSPDMIIGMDILRHLHVFIAFDEHKLYITEAGSAQSALISAQPAPP